MNEKIDRLDFLDKAYFTLRFDEFLLIDFHPIKMESNPHRSQKKI
jgi:hypothetical protein